MKAVYKLLIFTVLFLALAVISIIANLNNSNRENNDITTNYPEQIYFNKQLYIKNYKLQ